MGPLITVVPARGLLLFDSDCAFCTACASWLSRRHARVVVRPLSAADAGALGVDADRARREIPLVRGDGSVVWGAEAIGGALASCPPPWRWAGQVIASSPVRPLAARVYAWVARNRHRFPGGSGACRV
ncbi:thiol-disulfide oxidoreductase DCC family protein [Acidipropionibacterium virtanenii]|uniref:Thiol-disulfide oxidoreductase DCC n=1 Tax=Acidipropionibacterium virtanenii TaxID=2057246 RepID=A0A344UQF9_9ACTN|nr:DCC1-like thiol-disulfide oxidoreductase family protein [Acidipropionibacterium virtanenii]AXE37507.1 hypothetical protein JS278_00310 [Acidipropionibacterium virtanenii]